MIFLADEIGTKNSWQNIIRPPDEAILLRALRGGRGPGGDQARHLQDAQLRRQVHPGLLGRGRRVRRKERREEVLQH